MAEGTILFPTDQANEGNIIVNIIKSKENREYFSKYGNYKFFRLEYFKVISWAVMEMTKSNLEIDLDTILVVAKNCPVRFVLQYETLQQVTNTFETLPLKNFEVHVERLRIDAVKSNLLDAVSQSIVPSCLNPGATTSDLMDRVSYIKEIVETGFASSKTEFKGMEELIPQFIEEKSNKRDKYTTGFDQLDAYLTEGFKPGQITTVAGLSSSGKSSLTLSIMKNLANREVITAQFALEMPNMSLISKLMAFNSQLSIAEVVSDPDKLDSATKNRYIHELDRLQKNKHIFLNDKPSQGIPQIREQIMILQDKLKTEYMVVPIDLFGKIKEFQHSDNFARSYEQNINQVQIMARELKVHLILVAQINRSVANRKNKRPTMNDLKNSGALTEVSDIVLGVHRPYYDPDVAIKANIIEKINEQNAEFNFSDKSQQREKNALDFLMLGEGNKDLAEVIILKQRMGQNNVLVNFLFDSNTTCFTPVQEAYQIELNKSRFMEEAE